jgi:predicted small lipoprotein YifL
MPRILILTISTVIALTSLSACGRRAALDAPSAAVDPTVKAQPAPVEDKPFVLDRLLQ